MSTPTAPPIAHRAAERGIARAAFAVLSASSLAAGAWIALTHPVHPAAAVLLFAAFIVIGARWPSAWLFGIPALLPVMSFWPYTGRLVVEEWDLLVLGVACGGYASIGWAGRTSAPDDPPHRAASVWLLGLFAAFGVSGLYALYLGLAAAPGAFAHAGSQGYYEPLNSVRIYRGWLYAALLLPLLARALQRSRSSTLAALAGGFAASGAITALDVIRERIAFTGLANFSTDYRVTGPFWEMHVGGAALDAYLAFTWPFVLRLMLGRRSPVAVAAGALLCCMMIYAALATFSRGVYLGLPVAAAVYLVAASLQGRPQFRWSGRRILAAAGAAALLAIAWHVVFVGAGYRGMLAVLGGLTSALFLAGVARRASHRDWIFAAIGGAGAAIAAGLAFAWVPKGPYVAYALAGALALGLAWQAGRAGDVRMLRLALGAFVAQCLLAALVMVHWGGPRAFGAAVVPALLIALGIAVTMRPRIEVLATAGTRMLVLVGAAATAAVVAAFSGGAYMSGRFASSGEDMEHRLEHWAEAVNMLRRFDGLLFGRGLGRYPGDYFFQSRNGAFPGSYSLSSAADVHLLLAGPRYPAGFGELFRVSQRVEPQRRTYEATLAVRAPRDAVLHLEMCQKQLLYSESCVVANQTIKAAPTWQRVSVALDAARLKVTRWYEPRPVAFSMAVDSVGEVLEIDRVSLVDAQGHELLANGDFSDGMARWFFTSDRTHLPWHVKNLVLGVLYDQGLVGAVLLCLLIAAAAVRLAAGAASRDPLAPALLAALAGYLVVGLFDTVVDAPRVAFVFYGLLGLAALL